MIIIFYHFSKFVMILLGFTFYFSIVICSSLNAFSFNINSCISLQLHMVLIRFYNFDQNVTKSCLNHLFHYMVHISIIPNN
jgi:hypothetical protein